METIYLIDEHHTIVATIAADVITHQEIRGKIVSQQFTYEMRWIFESFDSMVENQMFSFLDQYEQYIEALNLKARIGDTDYTIFDLQIYQLEQISFQVEPVGSADE